MSNLLNIKDEQGNWIPIPVVTNGIASITQNDNYTLTITLEDGTTYTTSSIRGEKGAKGDKGDKGDTGNTGSKGDTGDKGDKGDKGDTGEVSYEELYSHLITDTASGAVASFEDGADDVPMKSVKVQIEPVQDLNGYNSPWAGGCGLNQNDPSISAEEIDVTGDSTYRYGRSFTGGKTYTIVNNSDIEIYAKMPKIDKSSYGSMMQIPSKQYKTVYPADNELLWVYVVAASTWDAESKNISVNLGSVMTFYPYSNICPISGWNGMNVQKTGKNLLPIPTETVTLPSGVVISASKEKLEISGTGNSYGIYNIDLSLVIPAGTKMVLNGNATGNGVVAFRVRNIEGGNYEGIALNSSKSVNFDVNRFQIAVNPNVEYSYTIKDIQLELGSTVTSYEPYKGNLYPVIWQDINVWDEEWEAGNISYDNGTDQYSESNVRSKNYIPVIGNETYYAHIGSGTGLRIIAYNSDKTFLSAISGTGSIANATFTIPAEASYIRIATVGYSSVVYNHDISINYPATYTAYYEHKGINYGTVYGGTLDVTTGELVVDKAMVDLGTLTWYMDGNRFGASVDGMPNKTGRTIKMLCDCYKSLVNGEAYDQNANNVCYGAYSKIYVHDFAYTNASIFKTAVTGHQLVYELATPIEIQLTPTEIRSLLGQNNLFADTGDSTVEYRADTKLYIQKKITEAVSALT